MKFAAQKAGLMTVYWCDRSLPEINLFMKATAHYRIGKWDRLLIENLFWHKI